MFQIILKKILNKRIMTLCLVLGLTLLVAAISCQGVYKNGSLSRVIASNFDEYVELNNSYPFAISIDNEYEYSEGIFEEIDSKYNLIRSIIADYFSYLGVNNSERILSASEALLTSVGVVGKDGNGHFAENKFENSTMLTLTNIPSLREHVTLYDYSDEYEDERYYSCLIPEYTIDRSILHVGSILRFNDVYDSKGNQLVLVVTGAFRQKDPYDTFFYTSLEELSGRVYLNDEDFAEIFEQYNVGNIRCLDNELIDYTKLNSVNIEDTKYYIDEISKNISITENFSLQYESYILSKKSIEITLFVMQLPLLAMIAAFIYMVTEQIVLGEVNEIAIQKSRGMTRWQVIKMYIYQSAILSMISFVLGIPLGLLMGKIAGSATDFLTFDFGNMYIYKFAAQSVWQSLFGIVFGMFCFIIPVIRYSGVSITQVKSNYRMNEKTIWEKCFLDIILLILSLYLLYNFRQNIGNIRESALLGKMTDPLVFIDTCLFLVALAMCILRILRMFINLLYKLFQKHFSTSVYTAFLEVIRNYNKSQLIAVYLILTIALGIFYSNTARSINSNQEERLTYSSGCDIRISEPFSMVVYKDKTDLSQYNEAIKKYKYKEPAYGRYSGLCEQKIADSITRVTINNSTVISRDKKSVNNCEVMGINTKEFGMTASLKDGLNGGTHWYNYLNELAKEPSGVIISSNLASELKADIGDIISLNRMGEFAPYLETSLGNLSAKVVAIVDDWPSYERYSYTEEQDENNQLKLVEHEQYLAVINYDAGVYAYGVFPYEVWVNMADGVEKEDVVNYLTAESISDASVFALKDEIDKMKKSLSIQIINGMFTLGFIISLIVCAAGFLIYWITSIRRREFQFGVYRAMGMSVKDINVMIITEHILSTLFSIVSGIGAGVLATFLFEKIFCIMYIPKNHNLDIYMYYEVSDIIKLSVIIIAIVATCLLIIRRQMKSLNISKALKLGEE